jgi:hypothetical protein
VFGPTGLDVHGIVHLLDLYTRTGVAAEHARTAVFLPVSDAIRQLRH